MTERLKTLCSLIDRCESFIDVGCDHGYVVKFVSDNGLAEKITACDISAPSLNKAKRLIGESAGVSFVCADGKDAAIGHDIVLVSGMGGLEILSVMSGCAPRAFILSPQSHVREVREELLRRDYFIAFDRVVRDGGKFYDVIKATAGGGIKQSESLTGGELSHGIYAKTENYALTQKLQKLLAAFEGFPGTEENAEKKREIEEVLSWQQR